MSRQSSSKSEISSSDKITLRSQNNNFDKLALILRYLSQFIKNILEKEEKGLAGQEFKSPKAFLY